MELFAWSEPGKPLGRLTSATYSFGLAQWAALGYLKRGVDLPVLTARIGQRSCDVQVKELPFIQ
jgi:glycine cleavage system aminomethyltransferase T